LSDSITLDESLGLLKIIAPPPHFTFWISHGSASTSYALDWESRNWIELEGLEGLRAFWKGSSLEVRLGEASVSFSKASLKTLATGFSKLQTVVSNDKVRIEIEDEEIVRKIVTSTQQSFFGRTFKIGRGKRAGRGRRPTKSRN